MTWENARVLLLTPEIPEPQRQSGSRRLFHHAEFLLEAGAQVTVVAEYIGNPQEQLRLQQLGIPVYAVSELESVLEHQAFNLAVVAFWHFAETWMPLLRERGPALAVVVDAIDLDFVRSAREQLGASSNGGARALEATYGERMQRELSVYASADRVLTVSEKEQETVRDLVNDRGLAVCVPDYEEFPPSTVPLEERKGVLFVGNFRHPPNGEALEFMCEQIVPRIDRAKLERHPVQVVGNALEGPLLELCRRTDGVQPVGFVPSLLPYFAASRAFVAPLLTGAGTKRKLIQALMVGVPAVVTSVAMEGLEIADGKGAILADDPKDFAAEVERLLDDDEHWEEIAGRGRDPILQGHGRGYVGSRLLEAIAPLMPGSKKDLMKTDWDERARENAMHYVDSSRVEWSEEDFSASGRASVEDSITPDLDVICRGMEASEMRMLEIGCGVGRMTRHLAEIFGEVHGVDVSGEMIAQARERLADVPNVELLETNGIDLAPFEDEFFDFAYSFIVFQHIPEKETIVGYLREVHRTLKPGCLFKFQVQGKEIRRTDTWLGAGFTATEMDSLAAEIGFTPNRTEGEGTQYFWNWWVRDPG